jgi:hypothetical protein
VPSQRSTHRPSQQSISTLYAPLTSELPLNPTVEDLLSRGFTYAYSDTYDDSTRKPAQDYYEKSFTATRDGKLVEVHDTVGIPSQRR